MIWSPSPKAHASPKRKRRRSMLFALTCVFGLAAIIRLADGMGAFFAFASAQNSNVGAQSCEADDGTIALMGALRDREEKVTVQEGIVADRTRALELADKRIQEGLAALHAAEKELAATVTIADKAAEQDVARLVIVYETMKPKDAAPLFAAMSPEFASGFLGRMRPEAAAAIFANLNPETAYAISAIVAGRNAGAPLN
ncbi:MAG TPA: hypothetical protein VGC40_08745 [Paenirhodobacter sp.]